MNGWSREREKRKMEGRREGLSAKRKRAKENGREGGRKSGRRVELPVNR